MNIVATEVFQAPFLAWQILILRLGGAVVLCGLIGLERETKGRPAGLRTHILVGLASAIYCLIMLDLMARADSYPDMVRVDPLRIIEAVTGGVAFLAAGLIVFTQGHVRGLTTGAGMWLSAAVGLACGLGLWVIAGTATALSLVVIRLLGEIEDRIASDRPDDARSGDDRDGPH